jgi:hypothetical protein
MKQDWIAKYRGVLFNLIVNRRQRDVWDRVAGRVDTLVSQMPHPLQSFDLTAADGGSSSSLGDAPGCDEQPAA